MKNRLASVTLTLGLGLFSLIPAWGGGNGISCLKKLGHLISRHPPQKKKAPLPSQTVFADSAVPENEIKAWVQKISAHTTKATRFRYLNYLAGGPDGTIRDRALLTEAMERLYRHGVLSEKEIRQLTNDPRLKGLSKHIEIDSRGGRIIIHDHETEIKFSLIEKIARQVSGEESLASSQKTWRDFFLNSTLTVEELKALQGQLTLPIPTSKVSLYQLYIEFVQTFRPSTNGLIVSARNKMLPKYKKRTSLEAINSIQEIEKTNPDTAFLRKFRRSFNAIERYHKKTALKEFRQQKKAAPQDGRRWNDDELLAKAKKKTLGARNTYQKLYMGCRVMRKTDAHVKNFKRFALFLILSGLAIDGAAYTHHSPDGKVRTFSDEYFGQIKESMKKSRWWKVLSYELSFSIVNSAIKSIFLSNPLAGNMEKTAINYMRGIGMGAADSIAFHKFFNASTKDKKELFDQLVSHKNFDGFQDRIWKITKDAGLEQEFVDALDKDTLGKIDLELYGNLKGLSPSKAQEEIRHLLTDPKKREAVIEFHAELHARGGLLRKLGGLWDELSNLSPSAHPTLTPELLRGERAKEVFLEALSDAVYKAQAGRLIQTGSLGTDRFLFYRLYDIFSAAKSVFVNMIIYKIMCMGQGSKASTLLALGIKITENIFTSNLHWCVRNYAIGKSKRPDFKQIFATDSGEKESLCRWPFSDGLKPVPGGVPGGLKRLQIPKP
ncbi:MAG: hypothetical protein OXB88_10455 [Bacteriovoracales bacterium]|nr:hypothetical protein [Bacteriovoracales bacterium]